jgi:AcrR family transcriptional regulator
MAAQPQPEPFVSARREEILAIAGDLFAENGFGVTTVREIADAAGILSGSLYHHFDSKESMVDDLLHSFLDEILASYRRTVRAAPDPAAALRTLVHHAFGALGSHRAAVAIMLNEWNVLAPLPRFAYLADGAAETERLWVRVLRDGVRSGAFRADIDPRQMYRFLRDAIWISVRWYRPDGAYRPADLADQYLAVLFDGLAPRTATTKRGHKP